MLSLAFAVNELGVTDPFGFLMFIQIYIKGVDYVRICLTNDEVLTPIIFHPSVESISEV